MLIKSRKQACFTPFQLPVPRSSTCIVELNNKIYFAGGVDSNQQTSRVIDILDTTTNTWSRRWLPTARLEMRCSAVGEHVVFSFGSTDSTNTEVHPYADIFDTSTQTFTASINLPTRGIRTITVFGPYIAYHYADQFIFLDPTNGTIHNRNIIMTYIVSNDTHLFGIRTRSNLMEVYPFDLDSLSTSSDPMYSIGMRLNSFSNPTVHLLDGYLVIRDIENINVYSFERRELNTITAEISIRHPTAVVYGSTLYLVSSQSILSYQQDVGIVHYSLPQDVNADGLSTVGHNGVLYFSGPSRDVITIVLDGLLQYVAGNFQFFRRRDIGMTFPRLLNTAVWINLHTQQVQRQRFDNLFMSTIVELDDYWVFNSGQVFHVPSETWTEFPPVSAFLYGSQSVTSLQGSVAVFSTSDKSSFLLFNSTDRSWRQIQGATVPAFDFFGVRDKIIVSSFTGDLEVIDVVTNERHLIQTQFRGQFVVTDDLFIMAGGFNTTTVPVQPTDLVLIYNAVSNTTQIDRLSEPGTPGVIAQSKTHVFFVSLGTVIDILNIADSTWSRVEMPSHFSNDGLQAVAGLQYLVIRRVQRVDIYDTLTRTWRVVADVPINSQNTAMRASGSKVVFFIDTGAVLFDLTTGDWFRIDGPLSVSQVQITDSFAVWNRGFQLLYRSLSTMTNTILSQSTYETRSIELDAGLSGSLKNIHVDWLHNSVSLNVSNSRLTLDNLQQTDNGEYLISVTDQCNQRMMQRANIQVIPRPTFGRPLEDSISLCHSSVIVETQVNGETDLEWTINGVVQSTSTSNITIQPDRLECNARHQLCLTATNPSGSNQTCGYLRLLEEDKVFSGPRPTEDHKTWFLGSQATLEVTLLEEDCTSHQWLVDGIAQETVESQHSVLTVNISALSSFTQYAVRAHCGSSYVTSSPFKFTGVSTLEDWQLALIIVLIFVAVLGAVIAAVLVRRRLRKGQDHEMELQNLLTQAKSESLNRDGVSFIPSTTWEWKPTDEFTYQPLDKLPCSVDSSMLSHSSKDHTVKVDTWNQAEIVFSLKAKKSNTSDNGLKERLIDGMQVDIYAPQSPKYDVKVEPSSFTLKQGKATHVTVSTLMRMTTKCKICLVIVIEQQQVYGILEYKMASGMSTWIDLEEVEMTGDFLGGGGFGSVTRGVYRGEEVAVKKLLNQSMIEELKQEFEREITLMKDLRHPNIVQFVGASNVKDNLAILIEYAPLGSLSSVMQKTKLSYMMKLTILLESAKALQFLHLNRVIHRDIKPQNILVFSLEPKASVHVKLTDFGTSRFVSDTSMTVTKYVGTMNYMAPEALGKNPRIDKSADIYSFALLIWEVMYERPPFAEFEWQSDVENHVKNGGRLPLDRVNGVNDDLIKLIEDCWHSDPSARPSASEVVQRLSELL